MIRLEPGPDTPSRTRARYEPSPVVYQDRPLETARPSLRTAIHFFCERHPEVIYFPSYEMIVRRPEWPYSSDNRHVRTLPFGQRIMEAFMHYYGPRRESGLELKPRDGRPGRTLPSHYSWVTAHVGG